LGEWCEADHSGHQKISSPAAMNLEALRASADALGRIAKGISRSNSGSAHAAHDDRGGKSAHSERRLTQRERNVYKPSRILTQREGPSASPPRNGEGCRGLGSGLGSCLGLGVSKEAQCRGVQRWSRRSWTSIPSPFNDEDLNLIPNEDLNLLTPDADQAFLDKYGVTLNNAILGEEKHLPGANSEKSHLQ